ncbi:MAG TPA: arginine--tRNA ligase [Candidatus Paceibacterota bacterium]
MTTEIKQALSQALTLIFDDIEVTVELGRPPPGQGDYSWCATSAAHQLGVEPTSLARRIADVLAPEGIASRISVAGPYVNIWASALFEKAIASSRDKLVLSIHEALAAERIMVEYLSPNTNKPLHLGHVRNGVLGTSVANILEAAGHTVIRGNLVNDRGIHICKSMLVYDRFGNGQTPESAGRKSDHFVGDWYIRYAAESGKDDALKPEAEDMLRKWEAGDPSVMALWKRMNDWVYAGFAETYARYGFRFDAMYYESQTYRLGKDIVAEGIGRGIFVRRDDGSVAYPLPDSFGKDKNGNERSETVLRKDGTSVYLTQDLGTAVRKADDWNLDRSLYVVASEQDQHFAALFSMLRAFEYPWASRCYHLSYGMVELPEGRMKSREGTVVDADDLADEMQKLAAQVIRSKAESPVADEEVMRRADIIGLAAIKFYLLGFGSTKKILFDPKKSLAFEGDTGPYCLYTYARIRSLVAKADAAGLVERFTKLGNPEERELAREIIDFPDVVLRAAEDYNPTLVAKRTIVLARSFNRFYKAHPIFKCEDAVLRNERLALACAAGESIRWGLSLLGIETLERM